MKFDHCEDCFCPFLSIGQSDAIECQENCMLRNPDTDKCSLTALEALIPKRSNPQDQEIR